MSAPERGEDHHAINVPLATVKGGLSRALSVYQRRWPARSTAWIGRIPKLMVRVRFS